MPVTSDCEPEHAISAAQAITSRDGVLLLGFVYVEDQDSLSTAARPVQATRKRLQVLAHEHGVQARTKVRASHQLWEELSRAIQAERPDLLILEWPCHFEALRVSPDEVLAQAPCDIAIVRGPVSYTPRRVLVPMRGGPYAELALRLSLEIFRQSRSELTALHMTSEGMKESQDAPFRGLAMVLNSLPEVTRLDVKTDDPAQVILAESHRHDLVIMGVSAQPQELQPSLGGVVQRLLQESPAGVIAVKSKRTIPSGFQSETVGQTAISVLVDKWFAENTFVAEEFRDLQALYELKQQQGLTISLALPALNEEETIGNVIHTLQGALMRDVPLLEEMVVIDSDSSDRTRQIAVDLGVPVFIHQQILPQYGARSGKGEALWKSLFVTRGDIVVWVDTDIVNIHPRFVYGLLGALVCNPEIHFIKGFYRRPIKVGDQVQAGGGGRVTELTARPLLNMFYPELSGLIQPLSGEYGGRRSALEQLPFYSGYGVEVGLLIDIFERFGLDHIAQVDLLERIHHNQPLEALSKMSFAIIQAVLHKLEKRFEYNIIEDVNKSMKLIRYEPVRFFLEVQEIFERERPPMITLPEYREQQVRLRS